LSWIRGAPGDLVGKLMGLAELRMTGRLNRKRKKGWEGGGFLENLKEDSNKKFKFKFEFKQHKLKLQHVCNNKLL
jgi:hypothetical protein